LALILLVPPFRSVVGLLIWDKTILALYEGLRLYRVWPLFIAFFVFVSAGYYFSRPHLWRHAFNRRTIQLAIFTLELPRFEEGYNLLHRWWAVWASRVRWAVYERLPKALREMLLTSETQALLKRYSSNVLLRAYPLPNRRYLAIVRARLDTAVQRWQDRLFSTPVQVTACLDVPATAILPPVYDRFLSALSDTLQIPKTGLRILNVDSTGRQVTLAIPQVTAQLLVAMCQHHGGIALSEWPIVQVILQPGWLPQEEGTAEEEYFWQDLWNLLRRDRRYWREHILCGRSLDSVPFEALSSVLVVLEEQLAVAHYHNRVLGRPAHIEFELVKEIEELLGQESSALGQAARDHFSVICSFTNADPNLVISSVNALGRLLNAVEALAQSPDGVWAAAIAKCHAALEIERLLTYDCNQEAIQVKYEVDAALEPVLQPPSGTKERSMPADWVERVKGWILQDTLPQDPFWSVALALPLETHWIDAIMAETWIELSCSLDAVLSRDQQLVSDTSLSPRTSRLTRPDSLSEVAQKALRRGYVGYTAYEAQGYASARDKHTTERTESIIHTTGLGRSSEQIQSMRANLGRRTCLIGEIWQVPGHPDDARQILGQPHGWRRIGIDLWSQSFVFVLSSAAALGILLLLGGLYLFRLLPPRAAWIADLRFSSNYADRPITSGTLAGDDWLVLGTDGRGVQAYHRDSGTLGLWHSYTITNTRQGLLGERVLDVSANAEGVWYVVPDGGVSWSSPNLADWQPMIGVQGFAPIEQDEIVAASLSPDRRFLAIYADRAGLGVYDTTMHNWIGQTQLDSAAIALAFSGDRVFAGTSKGLLAFRLEEHGSGFRLTADETLSVGGVSIVRFHSGPTWLLAVTEEKGLLGLPQLPERSWQWLVGESGFDIPPFAVGDIGATALDGEALWIAVNNSVGRYTLGDHTWQTLVPDGSPVVALATFGGTGWAGTAGGLYRYVNEAWQRAPQPDGVKQLVASPSRLWVVTRDQGVGFIGQDGLWHTAIREFPFGGSDAPLVTDVVAFEQEYWVASANAGVASYEWTQHAWHDRRAGLAGYGTAVMELQPSVEGLWAFIAPTPDAAPPYQVWHWDSDAWVSLTGTTGFEYAAFNGYPWLLSGEGDLLQLSAPGGQRYFQTTAFDPKQFRSFALDTDNGRVLVGGEEGLLAYELDTHSWKKLGSTSIADLAWQDGQLYQATGDGGLIGQATVIPAARTSLSANRFSTAALLGGGVWLSDGAHVFKYVPAEHSLTEEASIPRATAIQFRVVSNNLLSLAKRTDGEHLYLYDQQNKNWGQVDQGQDVRSYGTTQDTVIYADEQGVLHFWAPGQEQVYFRGSFSGLTNLTQAVQAGDGAVWALSSSGLARYDPKWGEWTSADIENPLQAVLAQDREGEELLLVASSEGLYQQYTGGDQGAVRVTNQPTLGLAQIGGNTFVLVSQPAAIMLWNGEGLDTLQPFTVSTSLLLNGQIVQVAPPTELVAGGGALWARHTDSVIGYQFQGTRLVPMSRVPLPAGSQTARLVGGGTTASVYLGTTSECWQMQTGNWAACPQPDLLAQSRTEIPDPYGRFTWQVAPLRAQVIGAGIAADHFTSDRVQTLQVGADGHLFVETASGIWSAPAGSAVGWESRQLGDGGLDPSRVSVTLRVAGDPWQWVLTTDPTTLGDTLTISWPEEASFVRQITDGRFTDETATAVAVFEDRLWIGTRAGLWVTTLQDGSLVERQWVNALPPIAVNRLVASDVALYVFLQDNTIRRYQEGQWESVSAPPEDAWIKVKGDFDEILFRETIAGMQTAPFTSRAEPRFQRDQLLSIAGSSNSLWLATSKGLLQTRPTNTGLGIEAVFFEGASIATCKLAADDRGVYAQIGAGATTYQYDGKDWIPVDVETTPWAAEVPLPASLPDVPLRWVRSNREARVFPQLGERKVGWQGGRLTIDIVREIYLDADLLYLATGGGPLTYPDNPALITPVYLPDAELARIDAVDIGPTNGGLWVKDQAGSYTAFVVNGAVLGKQTAVSGDQLLRSSLSFAGGRWQVRVSPLAAPLVDSDRVSGETLFTPDGRFVFDQVNDASDSVWGILLGTDGGILNYEVAPLVQADSWDVPRAGVITRVATNDSGQWFAAGDEIYHRGSNRGSWEPSTDSTPLLPLGVELAATGWTSFPWDVQQSICPLRIVGLADPSPPFAANGKFVFDNVSAVLAGAESTWLLTDAGWVNAIHAVDGNGFSQFWVLGQGSSLAGRNPRRVFFGSGESLVVDTEDGARLVWAISGGQLQPAEEQIGEFQTELVQPAYQASNFEESSIAILDGNEPQFITSAAQWFWPFGSRLAHKDIPMIVEFLDDAESLWAVTPGGVIRVDKRRMGIR
jgi:ligand-binding sensor domain-containing protein